MNMNWSQLPKSRLQCTVEVPAELVSRVWDEVLGELRKNYKNIPGFRAQDKVPEHLIIHEHGGTDKFKYTVIEALLESTVGQALSTHAERMIVDSDRFDDPIEELFKRFDRNQPFTYSISADIFPEMKWKGSYDNLKLEVPIMDEGDPNEVIDRTILESRKERSKKTIVEGRGVEKGDLCIVSFEARRLADDELLPGSRHERMGLDTTNPNHIPMEGLVEAIEGMQVEETRVVVLPVPEAWGEMGLGESKAKAIITLKELLAYELPEVTDDWVQASFPGQVSVEGLRENLLHAQQVKTNTETKDRVRMAITMEIGNLVDCQIPEVMIEEVAKNEFQAKLLEVGSKVGMETMKDLSNEQAFRAYVDNRRDELELMQRAIMGVENIFETQGLSISDQDLAEEVNEALEEARRQGTELDKERLREQAHELLKAQTVHDWLEDKAEIKLVPIAVGV